MPYDFYTNNTTRPGYQMLQTDMMEYSSLQPQEQTGFGRPQFTQALQRLGIKRGDIVYVRASLGAIGKLQGELFDIVVGGFLDAVGDTGTVMAPAFTKIGHVFSRTQYVIDSQTAPYSGAVSKLFLKHPQAVRSTHPSHSFVAIGPQAKTLLEGHGPTESCFYPVKKLAELDGKMLLVGCNKDSPGFSTVHVAQYDLGLSQRHLVRYLQKASIRRPHGGELINWRPRESPGCSASFDKFYPAYLNDENLFSGYIGQAFTLLIPSAKRALQADVEILRQNPTFVDCGRASCLTCGFRGYQLLRLPKTILCAAWSRLFARG